MDTVLLHETGIYVFETKNISGAISGSIEQKQWSQIVNSRASHSFYNPVLQNMGHMRALLHKLHVRLEKTPIYSFIVFSDRCTLRLAPVSGTFGRGDDCWRLLHLSELKGVLKESMMKRPSIYHSKQLETWWKELQSCINVDESVKKSHAESIQRLHHHN
ncbi:nuclease-related domain-containing protein [Fibrobacter sp. HC4]|uniref:nuclease-related domain-containing protein n=1 Tax=Fibrobacter sp. HC4 TaxID=3239812 RepID=UPI0031FEFE5A